MIPILYQDPRFVVLDKPPGLAVHPGPRGGPSVAAAPSRGSSDSSEITVQLLSRVEALEGQVRRLRGQVDEVANQTQRQGDDLIGAV